MSGTAEKDHDKPQVQICLINLADVICSHRLGTHNHKMILAETSNDVKRIFFSLYQHEYN